MGSCLSCRSSSVSCEENSIYVRVVDANGYVQDYDHPVMVRQLIGKYKNKQFVSTAEKLLCCNGSKQLSLETQLQPGKIYFLLPFYTLEDAASPLDYIAIVKKLSSIANSTAYNSSQLTPIPKRCCGDRSWKPVLDLIREESFTLRTQSELYQQHINLD